MVSRYNQRKYEVILSFFLYIGLDDKNCTMKINCLVDPRIKPNHVLVMCITIELNTYFPILIHYLLGSLYSCFYTNL